MDKSNRYFLMRNKSSIMGLENLISYIQKTHNTKEMNMIEIGSYVGESTIIFSKHFKNVLSVDPYEDNYDPNDVICTYAPFEKVYEKFMERTEEIYNIVNFRLTSDNACKVLHKRKYDFVYIDGMHTYEQVKKDILNYLPLIQKNGFIGGHDYIDRFDGVIKAVNEVIGKPDAVFRDGSWIKKITNINLK